MGNSPGRPQSPAPAPPGPPPRTPLSRRVSEPPAPQSLDRFGPQSRLRGLSTAVEGDEEPPAPPLQSFGSQQRPSATPMLPLDAIKLWRTGGTSRGPLCDACGTPVSSAAASPDARTTTHLRSPHPDCTLCPVVARFNEHPKEAFKDLARSVRVDGAPVVARFLHETPFLHKQTVGRFLAEAAHVGVLGEFARTFPFHGLPFEAAFRLYISFFALAGEAQAIDRIVEAFAAAYVSSNTGEADFPFSHPDVAYTLAFAAIMLHTDAHSDRIRSHDRMTKASFVRNHSRVDQGADLPESMLEALFDGIVSKPLTAAVNLEPACEGGEVDLLFGHGPLGMQLETQFESVVVAAVEPGSQASQHSQLRPGLAVVGVNGESVVGIGYDQTLLRLRTSPRPMWVRVSQPEEHFQHRSGSR